MAYTLEGKTVTSPVTVKVFIEDAAVDFVARHTTMGKREARKEMARMICGYGSFAEYSYLTVDGGDLHFHNREFDEGDGDDHIFGYFVYAVVVK